MHASDAAKSEMRVVIPGPFGRVEVRSVHRGEFDPADGVGLRVPDDREAVFGDIQYIGSVCERTVGGTAVWARAAAVSRSAPSSRVSRFMVKVVSVRNPKVCFYFLLSNFSFY